ncbi:hypothetical protein M408DRAFT_309058 [Serendipita vermifera MAFF 305830]|uniref:NACHT domain-containing protein n=1 Tax=Serendipita vermifera MAFF 305830 TaxID=933852 RepID=A0A0C2XGB5_SERVB|nr:hypothetical protein M408DRAFT_309058 [Serendipita vermifera MAFF 305830]
MAPDPDSPILAPLRAYSLELERMFRALLEEQRIQESNLAAKFQPVKDFLRRAGAVKTGGESGGGYSARLNDAMNQLMVSLTIYMGFTMHSINQKLSLIEAKLGNTEVQSVTAQGVQHHECLPQTRTEILGEIEAWLNSSSSYPSVFCLGDTAGTGKSTIANHVAREWQRRGCLIARFFFSRGNTGVSTAYDLSPHFARTIRKRFPHIAKSNDDIQALSTASVEEQWLELVVEPLSSLTERPLVMVIDGLDQCSEDSRQVLLSCILETFESNELPNVKLFLTTRLESDIKRLLVDAGDLVRLESLQQHEANLKDVSHYIRHRFSKMPAPIMTEQDARSLEKRANGLFIFASTACNLLERSFNRTEMLKRILTSDGFTSLDGLYAEVLRRAVDVDDRSSLNSLRKVLAIIITATSPLSVDTITRFLSPIRPPIPVASIVDKLASVLSTGASHDPIHILHPTFREFLLHVKRSGQFAVSLHVGHSILAVASLQMLNELRPDVCRLVKPNAPLPLNKAVENLSSRIDELVSPALQYASANWAAHALPVLHKVEVCDLMRQFFKKRLLQWIEVVALSGKTAELMRMLYQLQSGIETRLQLHNCAHDTDKQWCIDILDFLRRNQSLMQLSALHVYSSALVFTASNSLVYQHYHPVFRTSLPFVPGGVASRASGQTVLHGHHGDVTGVAFSPDGTLLATTSSDGSLLLWGTETGALVSTYHEQDSALLCVTYSPDGSAVISGARDGSIQKWNGHNGDRVGSAWDPNHGPILAVAWSPDGTRVALGTEAGNIVEIDADTGDTIGSSAEHTGAVNALVYSKGGRFLASASSDTTVRIWNTSLKKGLVSRPHFFSHRSAVQFIALSPSPTRKHLASCADVFHIWNIDNGEEFFRGELTGICKSLVYSPDGNKLLMGSGNDIIQRDATGGVNKNSFIGHTDEVLSLAYSPTGKSIVSTSRDKTARIWKATQGKNAASLTKHQGRVQYLAFSSDGTSLASIASDETLAIWNVKDGTLKKGPIPASLSPIAFHPDGKRVALISSNGVQLWTVGASLKKSSLLPIKLDNPANINAITFSPNGQYIAVKETIQFTRELSVWKLSRVDSKSPAVERILRVPVEEGSVAFHKTSRYVCCSGYAWDLNETPAECISFQKDLDEILLDALPSSLHYQRDHGFNWIELGSPPLHSFAIPHEIDVFSNAIRNGIIALGTSDGRVVFVDCSVLAAGLTRRRSRSLLNYSERDAVPGQ